MSFERGKLGLIDPCRWRHLRWSQQILVPTVAVARGCCSDPRERRLMLLCALCDSPSSVINLPATGDTYRASGVIHAAETNPSGRAECRSGAARDFWVEMFPDKASADVTKLVGRDSGGPVGGSVLVQNWEHFRQRSDRRDGGNRPCRNQKVNSDNRDGQKISDGCAGRLDFPR